MANVNNRRTGLLFSARWLIVFGLGCFAVVVLAHVCESLHLFPFMGWGRRDSAGHYLDLAAALVGVMFLPSGFLTLFLSRFQKHSE